MEGSHPENLPLRSESATVLDRLSELSHTHCALGTDLIESPDSDPTVSSVNNYSAPIIAYDDDTLPSYVDSECETLPDEPDSIFYVPTGHLLNPRAGSKKPKRATVTNDPFVDNILSKYPNTVSCLPTYAESPPRSFPTEDTTHEDILPAQRTEWLNKDINVPLLRKSVHTIPHELRPHLPFRRRINPDEHGSGVTIGPLTVGRTEAIFRGFPLDYYHLDRKLQTEILRSTHEQAIEPIVPPSKLSTVTEICPPPTAPVRTPEKKWTHSPLNARSVSGLSNAEVLTVRHEIHSISLPPPPEAQICPQPTAPDPWEKKQNQPTNDGVGVLCTISGLPNAEVPFAEPGDSVVCIPLPQPPLADQTWISAHSGANLPQPDPFYQAYETPKWPPAPELLLKYIQAALDWRPPQPNLPKFHFQLTSEAAEANAKLLKKHNFDLNFHLHKPNCPTCPGYKVRPRSLLRPFL